MEYGYPEKRKSKKDLKRKRLARAYKHGGRFRSMNLESKEEGKEKEN